MRNRNRAARSGLTSRIGRDASGSSRASPARMARLAQQSWGRATWRRNSSQKNRTGRTIGRQWLMLSASACALGVGYLVVADPHDPNTVMPVCPTKIVTGLDCPACGGLRLVHDLLHGHARAAVHDNLFVLLCSPVLMYLIWRQARAVSLGEQARVPRPLAYGLAGAALVWMAVRNLPGWPLTPTSI
ncbi:DUF2752 domain-containing protein [Protofrankia symbiont of Coriaria ruscifolia]|uniref:DUF2752 domain-containing protein n=1 Tax=Protofrankia symbiont of Coriaria ruscifolia TaxID=1306542 RepID=UPI001F5E9E02|nr:DUF2752 domain-containing protein [Protofrankia symbiont of Coriaria ruscifolia]